MDLASPAVARVFTSQVIPAAAGPPLGSDVTRRRAAGRIGGAGNLDDFAVDWDACWLDDELIRDLDQWRSLLAQDRIRSVTGAFVAAWKEQDGSLCLARDAIGARSLVYARVPDGLLFASTLRALLDTGLLPRRLNLPAVARYLSYGYVPGRETLVVGIHKLLPGEIIRYRSGSLTHDRLWSLPPECLREEAGEERLRRELRSALEKSVLRRLPEGEPVGAFLSGGLDSSLVVALACCLHSEAVSTYSVSFGPDHPNELPFSSLVAEHCGTDHHIVEVSPEAVVRHLDETIALLNDPIGDPLTVPNALLFREAGLKVGVVLNGEGGDPCFGGPKNVPMLLAELLGDGANQPEALERYARERSYLRAHQKCYDDLCQMLAPEARVAIPPDCLEAELAPYFDDARWSRFVTKLMAINTVFKGGQHILPKVDALSEPLGVVARSPLFDRAVVELAFAIPPQLKLRGTVEKYLLKRAVSDLLPQAILDRPKSGMLVPVEGWFKGPLLGVARERLLDGLERYRLFERGYLERLLAGRLGGLRPRRGVKIWLLVTLESWLRTVFA